MESTRLKTLASLVDKDASIIDIGTDHAYLPIYLVENGITSMVCATDVSPKVLTYANSNIKKHNLDKIIKTKISDGFSNIEETFDIAIIAGMGTHTIKKILDTKNIPNTLIIQSNTDIPELRLFMNNLNYQISKEIALLENNIYYNIIKYTKGIEKLAEFDLLFGKSNNQDYYKYLYYKYLDLYNKSKLPNYLKYTNLLEKYR